MKYKFTINDFEGPLDLLLHLIKESNINICDINIVEITEQYLSFIEKEQNLNLNIASEYLIMAAELIEMKSKMLLPKQEKNIDEETDIKENLINKLIEYNKYKGVIPQLKELNNERNTIYTKSPENLNYLEKEKISNESSDVQVLLNAFNNFLNEQKDKCFCCGKSSINKWFDQCEFCGWVADYVQENKDSEDGPNILDIYECKRKYNGIKIKIKKYKWIENKEEWKEYIKVDKYCKYILLYDIKYL